LHRRYRRTADGIQFQPVAGTTITVRCRVPIFAVRCGLIACPIPCEGYTELSLSHIGRRHVPQYSDCL
jgi:hypothetical protein